MRLAPALVAAGALTLTGGALPHLSPASPGWAALAILLLMVGIVGLLVIVERSIKD